jgi:hypothetical protein
MSQILDLSYPAILAELGRHLVPGRTEARAFLAWFLEQYYRREETDAQDAVCDGPDDKGVDGIYVDDNFERIEILQSKLFQNASKRLGDASLKQFAGTLDQFASGTAALQLANATANQELAELIRNGNVPQLIDNGYEVTGVFLTNVRKDVARGAGHGLSPRPHCGRPQGPTAVSWFVTSRQRPSRRTHTNVPRRSVSVGAPLKVPRSVERF